MMSPEEAQKIVDTIPADEQERMSNIVMYTFILYIQKKENMDRDDAMLLAAKMCAAIQQIQESSKETYGVA